MDSMKKEYVYSWLCEIPLEMESIVISSLGAKYKIMLLMTYIDIFSQAWDVFSSNIAQNQKERFENWLNQFLLDDDFLLKSSEMGPLDADEIYKIRNALLHYAALPNLDKAVFISEKSKSEIIKNFPDKKGLESSVVLSPKLLYPKFIKAFGNTLMHLGDLEVRSNDKYTTAIDTLHSKLKKNSAMAIFPSEA